MHGGRGLALKGGKKKVVSRKKSLHLIGPRGRMAPPCKGVQGRVGNDPPTVKESKNSGQRKVKVLPQGLRSSGVVVKKAEPKKHCWKKLEKEHRELSMGNQSHLP